MGSIEDEIAKIRTAVYGKEVRAAIANSCEAAYTDAEKALMNCPYKFEIQADGTLRVYYEEETT